VGPSASATSHIASITAVWSRFGELARAQGADVATVLAFSETLWRWADAVMDVVGVARKAGIEQELPRRQPKAAKPTRRAVAFWVMGPGGELLLRRRPEKGLLGGMMEVPSTPWRAEVCSAAEARTAAPLEAAWRELPGQVRHTFTHFHFEVTVWAARSATAAAEYGRWVPLDRLADEAIPTVMRKIIDHGLKHTASADD